MAPPLCPKCSKECSYRNYDIVWAESEIVCDTHGVVGHHDSEFGLNSFIHIAEEERKRADMNPSQILSNLLVLATNAHAGQFDKGGTPYILHPLKVMHYLKTTDVELQCIALCHDVVEDCDVTYEDLEKAGANARIKLGIRALTKIPGQTYEEYCRGVLSNKDAMLVKLQDLRHNSDLRRMKGVTEKDVQRVAKYMAFYQRIKGELERF